MRPFFVDLEVGVVGGVGSVEFGSLAEAGGFPLERIYGRLRLVSFECPAGPAPTFDYAITDSDDFPVTCREGVVGDAPSVEDSPIIWGGTFHIANATADGTYRVRLNVFNSAPY